MYYVIASLPVALYSCALVFGLLGVELPFASAELRPLAQWMLFLSLALQSLWAAYGHIFVTERVAQSIGWQASPFQHEIGSANLGIGLGAIAAAILGPTAAWAILIVAACFLWGAAAVHVTDMFRTNNFAINNAGPIFWWDDLHEDGLPNLSTPEGQAAIDRVIGDAEVIIFDNVSTLFRSGRENEAESWMPVQDWLLKHRREGRTVVIVHHAGKGKAQRGTSRREDVLDVVLNLRAPSDYEPSEGARFEVHFEKARGLVGDHVEPFEAKLELRDGKAVWTKRDVEDSKLADIEELKNEGRTVRQIAQELSMSKSAVQRALNRIKEGQS